jgi:hypothetical protein
MTANWNNTLFVAVQSSIQIIGVCSLAPLVRPELQTILSTKLG